MAIRVVCFDLGGVLVKICRTMDEAAARVGLPAPDAARWQSGNWAAERSRVVRGYHRGELTCDAYYEALAAASVEHYTASQVREIHGSWILGEYPEVADVVMQLNTLPGLRSACLSNTAHAHWRQMTESEAASFPAVNGLQVKLASHLMHMVKPDREIYEAAVAHFGVRPEEVLFFDDLPENVAAARQAGLCAEQIQHDRETAPQIRQYLQRAGVLLSDARAR